MPTEIPIVNKADSILFSLAEACALLVVLLSKALIIVSTEAF